MANLSREAFSRLMAQVEELEETVDEREAEVRVAAKVGGAAGIAAAEKALETVREKLRVVREELARISDGCGHGHHH